MSIGLPFPGHPGQTARLFHGQMLQPLHGAINQLSLPMSSTQAEDSALDKSTAILRERRFKLSRYFVVGYGYLLLTLLHFT